MDLLSSVIGQKPIIFGNIIKNLRIDRGITQAALSAGLCSRRALDKVERGAGDADLMLLQTFVSRLGKSPAKLNYILSRRQCESIVMRLRFNDSINNDDREMTELILNQFEGLIQDGGKNSENDVINRLIFLRAKMVYEYYVNANSAKAFLLAEECAELTLPGWKRKPLSAYCISSYEIENMLAYIFYGLQEIIAGKETVSLSELKDKADEIGTYIEERISDNEELASIFPKLKWVQSQLLIYEGNIRDAVTTAEEGLQPLRRQSIFVFMIPLLETICKYGKGLSLKETVEQYCDYYAILKELIDTNGLSKNKQDNLFSRCDRAGHFPDWEIIRSQRIMRRMRREDLVDGIYKNIESLSRMECGKQSPNKTTFSKIMSKLGLDYGRVNSLLVCEDFETLEKMQNARQKVICGHYDEAESIIDELSGTVMAKYKKNLRAIELMYDTINLMRARSGDKEEFATLCQAIIEKDYNYLEESFLSCEGDFLRMPLPAEVEAISQAVFCYNELKEKAKGREITGKALKMFEQSFLDPRSNCRWYGVFLSNYAQLTRDEEVSKKAVCFQLEIGSADTIGQILGNWSIQQYQRDKDRRKEIGELKKALTMAKLFMQDATWNYINIYINKLTNNPDQKEE